MTEKISGKSVKSLKPDFEEKKPSLAVSMKKHMPTNKI